MDGVTENRVRALTKQDLGLPGDDAPPAPEVVALHPELEGDAILAQIRMALDLGFAGVILSGPPGTGKSWYASRVAEVLTGDPTTVWTVQFHTSYQYEDFMEGFVPRESGGFTLQSKTFPLICEAARERPDLLHVLVIDEISRCDVARVFGEALTYLETDKRGRDFLLASGNEMNVPRNLAILATMNPWDKGVDELDVALERRFAQLDLLPSVAALRTILAQRGTAPDLIDRMAVFFEGVQTVENELCHLGHAYLLTCDTPDRARQTWALRLRPFFQKACRLHPQVMADIEARWQHAMEGPAPAGGEA
ncbi:McrB family protein [uncultured Methylobacterium sp.]|uniref:McrB family protein n=1 Tax=uncultured Methylobacterium sp. TaxID=157278 RepID=UPI0035CB5026